MLVRTVFERLQFERSISSNFAIIWPTTLLSVVVWLKRFETTPSYNLLAFTERSLSDVHLDRPKLSNCSFESTMLIKFVELQMLSYNVWKQVHFEFTLNLIKRLNLFVRSSLIPKHTGGEPLLGRQARLTSF